MWQRPLLHVSYLPIQVLKTSLPLDYKNKTRIRKLQKKNTFLKILLPSELASDIYSVSKAVQFHGSPFKLCLIKRG